MAQDKTGGMEYKKMDKITCCLDCRNRHPGCHDDTCPDWVRHEEQKEEEYNSRLLTTQGRPDSLRLKQFIKQYTKEQKQGRHW